MKRKRSNDNGSHPHEDDSISETSTATSAATTRTTAHLPDAMAKVEPKRVCRRVMVLEMADRQDDNSHNIDDERDDLGASAAVVGMDGSYGMLFRSEFDTTPTSLVLPSTPPSPVSPSLMPSTGRTITPEGSVLDLSRSIEKETTTITSQASDDDCDYAVSCGPTAESTEHRPIPYTYGTTTTSASTTSTTRIALQRSVSVSGDEGPVNVAQARASMTVQLLQEHPSLHGTTITDPIGVVKAGRAITDDIALEDRPSAGQPPSRSWSTRLLLCLAVMLSVISSLSFVPKTGSGSQLLPSSASTLTASSSTKDTVCVSGGGFSGFWFTIGRLQSIRDPHEKDFYCYSAGCLSVVAALSNYTVDHMSDLAFGVQELWKNATLGQYEVVTDFVHKLVPVETMDGHDSVPPAIPKDLLRNINIITTVRKGWMGLEASVRQAENLEELREMLIQTAWM